MGIAQIGKKKRLDEERIKKAVREYGEAKEQSDAATRRMDAAKEELLNISGEYGLDEIETNDGTVMITEQAGRMTLDKKKLEEYFRDNPDTLEEMYTQGRPSPRINWKAKLLTE
jgi:hypothetical protein